MRGRSLPKVIDRMNNQSNTDIRDAFFDQLYDIAVKDRNVIFMTADMGAMSLEKFKKNLPGQYINVGISEQNLVSVAAGLALTGKKVFAYAITSFITQRCYEQIRVGLCGMNLPVAIIGSGPGITYNSDGPTHHAIEDVAIMRVLPNLTILSPCDAVSASFAAKNSYESNRPVYVRLDKGKLPPVYKNTDDLSGGLSFLMSGEDVAIVTTGVMAHNALIIADKLKEHSINASVLNIFRIKPINESILLDKIGKVKLIVTIEEHFIDGGIGSIVSEIVAGKGLSVPVMRLGITDKKLDRYGDREWMHGFYGLDVAAVKRAISYWFDCNNRVVNAEKLGEESLNLATEEFADLLGIDTEEIPENCKGIISKCDFTYRKLDPGRQEQTLLEVLKRLDTGTFSVTGDKTRWERGWGENLRNFIQKGEDFKELVPKYIRPNQLIRLWGNYILPNDNNFELNWYTVFRLWFFQKYLKNVTSVYEFGCGSGYNLPILAELFPHMELHGLDWINASCEIVDRLAMKMKIKMNGHLFDMFSPDEALDFNDNSAVLTMGGLEQLGNNFEPFLQYLLRKSPLICVHMEPFLELYNENSLFDYVAIKFHKIRQYLGNFISRLRQLEVEDKIEIIKIHRVSLGSFFHEGYSYAVWRPKSKKVL